MPRNTITTDDNYNNLDIVDSTVKDTLHAGRNINNTNAKDTTYTTNNIDNNNISNMDRIDSNINWDDVIKKEARGLDDADLGEVHEVGDDYIFTQKGAVHKHKYYLPKNLVTRFDGHKLWFKITEDEADKYKNAQDSTLDGDTVATDTNYSNRDLTEGTISNINWDDVIKKEARGLDDADLGEVHEVGDDYVFTQKGAVHKHKYYLPKNLVTRFDGHKLWFKITEDEADKYKRD